MKNIVLKTFSLLTFLFVGIQMNAATENLREKGPQREYSTDMAVRFHQGILEINISNMGILEGELEIFDHTGREVKYIPQVVLYDGYGSANFKVARSGAYIVVYTTPTKTFKAKLYIPRL